MNVYMAEGIRVLYVDDESDLLGIGKTFLERSGHFTVDTITSASAALTLLDSGEYDAIISDYKMPDMDGIDLLKRVRLSGKTVPFILFSGRGREEVVIQAINEGADFYIQKGGDPRSQFAELTHKVQIAVENHRAAKKIQSLNRLYSVLSATNRAMVRIRTKSEFFSEICRILVETGGFRMAWIGLADPERKAIQPVASAGHIDGYLDLLNISTEDVPRGRGPTGTAFREGRYSFSNHLAGDPNMAPWQEAALERGYQANAAFPFALGTRNAGVLSLYAPVTGFFDEQIIGLLEELAIDISFALKTIDEEVDRRSAEESIRDLERREADLINFLPDATFAIDRDGRVISWNRAIEEMTGVPAAEILGKRDYEYTVPFFGQRRPILIDLINESDEVIARRYAHIVRDGDILIADIALTLPSGRPVVLMGKAGPLYNRQGEIVGAIESIRDITERKRAEESLRESEGRFAAFMDRLPVTAFIKDDQFTNLFVNRHMEEVFGAGEWVGRSVRDLFPEDVAEVMIEDDRRTLEEGSRRTVENLVDKNGDRRIFETSKFRIDRESKPPLIGGFAVDITDRKRAEDAVRASEEQYRNVVEDQTEFVCRFRPDGTHVFVNDAYCRYFSVERDEILGHRFRPKVPAGDRERLDRFFASLTPDRPVDTIEHRIVMSDGDVCWQRWSDRAIFDSSGTIAEYQSVGRDITEQKATRAALEASEIRFRAQYQNNPLAIFTWQHRDGDFVLVDCNRAAEILSDGRSRGFLGKTASELYADRLELLSEVRQCFSEQGLITKELVSEHFLPGKRVHITAAFVPPDLVIVHMDDVTRRRQEEEALHENEQRLASIYNTVGDVIFQLAVEPDGRYRFTSVNSAFSTTTGLPPERVIGRTVNEIVPEPFLSSVLEGYRQVIEERAIVSREETAFYARREVIGEVRIAPIVDRAGTCTHLIVSIHDITERKRAEDRARTTAHRLDTLLSNLYSGVLMVSEDGTIERVNQAVCDLYNLPDPPESLVGLPVEEVTNRILEAHASPSRVISFIREGTSRGTPIKGAEIALRDGRIAMVDYIPIVDAAGERQGRIWHLHDITEQKQAEEALGQANSKLKLLFHITRHDITNQLSILMGYLTLLEERLTDAGSIEYFRKVMTAAERISAMLLFTKTYEEIGVGAPVWQDCQKLVDMAKDLVPLGRIEVINSLPAGTEVLADPLIVKVWYNLLEDSVRHGGAITTIRISMQGFGDGLLMLYEDDGDGIPENEKELIFERGFGKNTGFGLFLSREVLGITGITIRETGTPGEGARFEIAIPKGQYRSVVPTKPDFSARANVPKAE
jgi:PAS domain S-box-containing protein